MKYKHIVIEGNIGSGKTTLATKLATHFKAELVLEEFAENQFLKEFYNSNNGALPLELSFLNARHEQLTKAQERGKNNPLIADYYYRKSLIFAKNTLPENEFKLYESVFEKLMSHFQPPDLFIYLHCETDVLISRIKQRGREYEKNISPEYLTKISNEYLFFLRSQNKIKQVILDSAKLNFLESKKDFGTILEILGEDNFDGI